MKNIKNLKILMVLLIAMVYKTNVYGDTLLPRDITIVKCEEAAGKLELRWDGVTNDETGNVITEKIEGYRVMKAADYDGEWEMILETTTLSAVVETGSIYKVQAMASFEYESGEATALRKMIYYGNYAKKAENYTAQLPGGGVLRSLLGETGGVAVMENGTRKLDSGCTLTYYEAATRASRGRWVMDAVNRKYRAYAVDFGAWVDVPFDLFREMGSEENTAGEDYYMQLEKEDGSADGMMMNFTLQLYNRAGDKIEDFRYRKTRMGVEVVIDYKSLFMGSAEAKRSLFGGGVEPVLYWHNGVEWVKIGGDVDSLKGTISASIKRGGKFGLAASRRASEFTVTKVAPKIFTPEESDTRINKVRFSFENPNYAEVTIKIFDINGGLIKRNLERESEFVMYWDGKDMSGDRVREGVYLYQVETVEKVETGAIVVAK